MFACFRKTGIHVPFKQVYTCMIAWGKSCIHIYLSNRHIHDSVALIMCMSVLAKLGIHDKFFERQYIMHTSGLHGPNSYMTKCVQEKFQLWIQLLNNNTNDWIAFLNAAQYCLTLNTWKQSSGKFCICSEQWGGKSGFVWLALFYYNKL